MMDLFATGKMLDVFAVVKTMSTGEHIVKGWIGVDLDGTLAEYHGWPEDGESIGEPVSYMLHRVKEWVAEGRDVRIFTARVAPPSHGITWEQVERQHVLIKRWSVKHIGCALPATCMKDRAMIEFWDDRAVQVERNTGRIMGGR